ncbi:MAG TPA: hypothetical protein PKC03_03215, partial [Dokdonella sp.]|nr:hypothetical protein [Dokdonella sp.]
RKELLITCNEGISVNKLISGMAIMAVALSGQSALAQTCASPGGPVTTSPSSFQSACTAADEFDSICGGSVSAIGTSAVYQVNVGSPNNFSITVTPNSAGYDHAIFLIGPGCAQTANCVADADNAGPGAAEVVTIPNAQTPTLAAGTYYLVIDSTSSASGCVPSTVDVTGTLPVSLKNFSVE